jgi:hypothetical protein
MKGDKEMQMNIFDVKNAAISRVEINADPEWMQAALKAVHTLAVSRDTFTTDDVWDALSNVKCTTHEPRAMGAVMRHAAREGTIEASPNYRTSQRVECHGRPVRVWTSLLRQGAE